MTRRSFRKRRRILILIGVVALIAVLVAVVLVYPVPAQTNAKAGFYASYNYITTYGAAAYLNKFNVRVDSVTGNKVVFVYQQVVSGNATSNSAPEKNYSLAFDPGNGNTYEAGSAMPLFVANYLKNATGRTTFVPVGSTTSLTVNYTTLIAGGRVRVNFSSFSGSAASGGAYIVWRLNYDETTGILLSGFNIVESSVVSYSTYNFTLTSFAG